jgi:hypothetical protein
MVRCRGTNSGLTFERDDPIETSGAGIAASFERSPVASAQDDGRIAKRKIAGDKKM